MHTGDANSQQEPDPADHHGGLAGDDGIEIAYLPAPAPLRPAVMTLFHFACDKPELRDTFPAMVGFLSITLIGNGAVEFADGTNSGTFPVSLLTPTNAATALRAHGPFHAVGAVLTPLGWAALTGLHAGEHAERLYNARDWMGAEIEIFAEELRAAYLAGRLGPAELGDRLAGWIAQRMRPINPRHAELMRQVAAWMATSLDPPLEDLYARCAYSSRQVARLVERYYGCSPQMLVRKYRALRVAALLQASDTTPEQVAELINLYYDQSHLIRELRLFTGRTPSRLGDEDAPILNTLTDIRNYRQLNPQIAPLPRDTTPEG